MITEPNNSVGKPLLYFLQKNNIINCLIVLIIYFGGKKLGIGCSIRAYIKTGKNVIK